jgi:microcystin-dependent protein
LSLIVRSAKLRQLEVVTQLSCGEVLVTQPFIGQLQPMGFNFPPRNWALCDGQLLSIQQNTALFSLLGTYYGGNGVSTFQLPDLRSRVPMHNGTFAGSTYTIGEIGGVENVTLLQNNLPQHTHSFSGTSNNANFGSLNANGGALAQIYDPTGTAGNYYAPDATTQPLNPSSVGPAGRSLPHSNIQPYLTISWCIALYGIFPSRN